MDMAAPLHTSLHHCGLAYGTFLCLSIVLQCAFLAHLWTKKGFLFVVHSLVCGFRLGLRSLKKVRFYPICLGVYVVVEDW